MTEHKLKRGYDIKLAGVAAKEFHAIEKPKQFALQPPDFLGIKPKLLVHVGDKVKIGTPLFIDKQNPEFNFVSPASGEVVEINRGERRSIQEVVIKDDGNDAYESFETYDAKKIDQTSREDLIAAMMQSGVWPYLKQRPFSKIANPQILPRDIFVSGMDTAPLAADMTMIMEGQDEAFRLGMHVLNKLTEGTVYLAVDGRVEKLPTAYDNLDNVEVHKFDGPHPAGNISIHIAHIRPLNVGENVWYTYAQSVAAIGEFFATGRFPVNRIIAVAGSSVKPEARRYLQARVGTPVQALVHEGELLDHSVRYISGNVLSGRKIYENGYLGFYHNLLTVIPDSGQRDLFGWLTPGIKDESFSRTFLSRFFRSDAYVKDTRIHGGKRAFIQTGDYEEMLPLDIYPSHLVKAIMAEEIEDMIGLGLLEVAVEDFALCTYICPSKIDFGYWIHQGLNTLENEGE
jgi:Na+-transporting NADH:ubiquinone oxidoreductase subunit A